MIKPETINTKHFFKNALNKIVLPTERKNLLNKIAKNISEEYKKNGFVNINFICTHNSRRSQFSQVWAFYAIAYFNLKNMHSFSGGTEATAFYRNTVLALKEVGFVFDVIDFCHQNPKYLISFEGNKTKLLGFSKVYNDAVNEKPFIAVTTCNNADTNCPFIPEATERFHLPFVDPKHSDKSAHALKTYVETSKQIAAEMHFLFKNVTELVS